MEGLILKYIWKGKCKRINIKNIYEKVKEEKLINRRGGKKLMKERIKIKERKWMKGDIIN